MKKMIEKYLYVLVIVTCIFILVGCAGKPKPPKTLDPIANAKELGVALGCIFAPNSCKSEIENMKTQDEMTKEFDKIDADRDKEKQK